MTEHLQSRCQQDSLKNIVLKKNETSFFFSYFHLCSQLDPCRAAFLVCLVFAFWFGVFFSFLDFFILSLVRNISDCYPFFDLEHGSWEEAEQMAVLKLTTIWFLLLWQSLLPRKVLDENSWVPALRMAFIEMKMKFWESRSSSRSLLLPGVFGSDAPATWVQRFALL